MSVGAAAHEDDMSGRLVTITVPSDLFIIRMCYTIIWVTLLDL